jgi:hypothetical protein
MFSQFHYGHTITSEIHLVVYWIMINDWNYSKTSIHRFRRGSEKETMDPGKRIIRER